MSRESGKSDFQSGWSRDEIAGLARLGLLEFLPESMADYVQPGTVPIITGKPGLTIRDNVRQLWYLKNWFGCEEVFISQFWRDCLRLRHTENSLPAMALVPRQHRLMLKVEIEKHGAKYYGKQRIHTLLRQIRQMAFPAPLVGVRREIACIYALARIRKTGALYDLLTRLTSDPELYYSIWGVWSRPVGEEDWFPSKDQFLRYLTAEPGTSDQVLGKVLLYYLDREEPYKDEKLIIPEDLLPLWPKRTSWRQVRLSGAYKYIAEVYQAQFGVGREVFAEIQQEYDRQCCLRFRAEQSAYELAIFVITRIAASIVPAVYKECRHWVREFRKTSLRSLMRTTSAVRYLDKNAIILERVRLSLSANPLLKCVLHTEALGGHVEDRSVRKPGRPTKRGVDAVCTKAVELFELHYSNPESLTIGEVLTDKHRLSGPLLKLAKAIPGKGKFEALSPLLTALIQFKEYELSPAAIKHAHHRELKRRDPS